MVAGDLEPQCKDNQYYYIAGYRGFNSNGICVFQVTDSLVRRSDRPFVLDFTSKETVAPEKVWTYVPQEAEAVEENVAPAQDVKPVEESKPVVEEEVPNENRQQIRHVARYVGPSTRYGVEYQ